ncbi:MAG: GAF domain-containing protein [Anaerolineae bacterium]|nr:GAF domain-containing protein [Anaerolineae bacterium]
MNIAARFASLSVRVKLVLGLGVAALVLMIVAAFAISRYLESAEPVAGQLMRTVTAERANALSAGVNALVTAVQGFAQNETLQQHFTTLNTGTTEGVAYVAVRLAARDFVNANANIREVTYLTIYGAPLVTVQQGVSESPLHPVDHEALIREPITSGLHIGPLITEPEPRLDVLVPLDYAGARVGFLYFDVDPSRGPVSTVPGVYDALRPINTQAGQIFFYLVDQNSRVQSPFSEPVVTTEETRAAARALGSRAGASPTELLSPIINRRVLTYVSVVGNLGRRIVAETRAVQIASAPIEASPFLIQMGLYLVGAGIVLVGVWYFYEMTVIVPIRRLTQIAARAAQGQDIAEMETPAQNDEIGVLAQSFNSITELARQDIRALEARIAQRTRDIEATRDIAQFISSIRDLDALLSEVIELIRTRFPDVYHAQVFLLDPTRQYAVLRVSTGDAGKALLARGHRLPVGSQSVIGRATADGEAVVALDTSTSNVHRANELLPDTRAELALPLRTRDGIIGALDLQSRRPESFSDSDVRLFQSVADELAIAITNARLFEESQARLSEIEDLNRRLLGEAWQGYAASRRIRQGVKTGPETWSELQRQAVERRDLVERIENDLVVFAVPVILRDQIFGAVEWMVGRQNYNENIRLLARELADRLAVSADNARLLEHTQRLAYRERLVSDIAGKLVQQLDVSQVLQTAVRELGLALQAPQTTIRLTLAQESAEIVTEALPQGGEDSPEAPDTVGMKLEGTR